MTLLWNRDWSRATGGLSDRQRVLGPGTNSDGTWTKFQDKECRTFQIYYGAIVRHLPAICAISLFLHTGAVAAEKPILAVADFDFSDTSGEPLDQSAEHRRRLADFSTYLRQQLTELGGFAIADLPCQGKQCTATDPGFLALSAFAKNAGADYLVIGIIRKTSTLIGWVEYSVLDVDDSRSICGRLVSYRGDTDEAWRRAARFSADQVVRHCGLVKN